MAETRPLAQNARGRVVADLRLAFLSEGGLVGGRNCPSLETREGGGVADLRLAFRAREGWRCQAKSLFGNKS